jgi:hypothetical protein
MSLLMAKHISFTPAVAASRDKRLVTMSLDLASPEESMTITASVPSDRREQDVYALSPARARDFARHFLELSSSVQREGLSGLLIGMPLSPEQEALCERLEKGESTPVAAALIRAQAHEIDNLWDRLSRAYALIRQEFPSEMIQEEITEIRRLLEGPRHSQLGTTD